MLLFVLFGENTVLKHIQEIHAASTVLLFTQRFVCLSAQCILANYGFKFILSQQHIVDCGLVITIHNSDENTNSLCIHILRSHIFKHFIFN